MASFTAGPAPSKPTYSGRQPTFASSSSKYCFSAATRAASSMRAPWSPVAGVPMRTPVCSALLFVSALWPQAVSASSITAASAAARILLHLFMFFSLLK